MVKVGSDAQRRILDLLAGWEKYVSDTLDGEVWRGHADRDAVEHELACISELYQRVGAKEDFDYFDYREAMSEIREIVRTGSY